MRLATSATTLIFSHNKFSINQRRQLCRLWKRSFSVNPERDDQKTNDSMKEKQPSAPNPTNSPSIGKNDFNFQTAGVFRDSETEDIKTLVDNFTAPALAMALRDRETTLQNAAFLVHSNNIDKLKDLLSPFLKTNVEQRRTRNDILDFSQPFLKKDLIVIQRYLHKMPRHVYQAAASRASVLIPLCNDNGVASVLFERRSSKVRTHKLQVCFPGGMLDKEDQTIIQTSLREMEEELGISKEKIDVLGILRCNWNEVASMTGIAVTPVIGFIGEISDLILTPNSDEVEEYFTIPIEMIMNDQYWMIRNFSTPVFNGGPYAIWGLTGYLLDRFRQDILAKCASPTP
jgi:nudix motif 8